MAEWQRIPDGIGDTIPKMKVDPEAPQTEVWCHRGIWSHGPGISCRGGAVNQENFPAGKTTHFVFWYDEVQYILDGKAELTYTLWQNRFTVEKKMTVEKGDIYIIPKGADIHFKVDPSGPLKKLCVMMPAPDDYVGVTGVSSCEKVGGELHRLIRVREQTDIVQF